MTMTSKSTWVLTLLVLFALTAEVWQFRQTALLEDDLAAASKTKAPAVHAVPKPPAPAAEPAREFTGEAAEPGKPMTLADGTVVTVTDSTPRNITVHRPANTGTILAQYGDEVRQITVDDIKNDPDLMNQLTGAAKTAAQREFANYLKQSGLTPEQQAQFQDVMTDRTTQIWLASLQLATSGDITTEKLAALNQQVSGIEQAATASLRPLYETDDDFASMQNFPAQGLYQNVLTTLGQFAKSPLSPEQSDAITGIIAEEYAKAQLPEPMVASIIWGLNSDMAPLTDIFQQMQKNIQDRIAAVLTPEQAAALNSTPIGGMMLKNAMMRPTVTMDSAMAFTSTDAPNFKFYPGDRSGMGSSGGGFGYTKTGPDGTTHSSNYMEVNMHTD